MRTIHHVLDIDATKSNVWSALTVPDRMAGWWSTKVTSPPAAVGAVVKWTFVEPFNPDMEITELKEHELLEWKCVGGHENWADNLFRFELTQLDDGRTRLRFWQEYATELSDDDFGVYNFNWGYYLESLRLFCSTGTGKPFDVDAGASR
jgi:uncharacterized protein YndB with AHSA1/START domain